VEGDVVEVDFPKRAPTSRDLERRPIADDYRPLRYRVGAADPEVAAGPARNELHTADHRGTGMNTGTSVNLRKLHEQLDRKPLDEIAMLVQALTYGEMVELAEAIWKIQPDGSTVTQENLAALLHRWSKSRSAVVEAGTQVPHSA
jgi:hypothetical protein